MSIINKMLRDLDGRQAAPPLAKPGTAPEAVPQAVKPVVAKTRRDFGEAFWRALGGIMVIVVGWIVWLIYQLTPHPLVALIAYELRSKTRVAANESATPAAVPAPVAGPAAPIAPVAPAVPAAQLAPPPLTAAAPAPAVERVEPAKPGVPKPDMLKLTTELAAPPLRPSVKPVAARAEAPAKSIGKAAAEAKRDVPANVAALAPPTPPKPEPALGARPIAPGKIERRESVSPRERAELELRRAVALVNQGRMAEGMEAFRTALQIDPAHEAARQTMVALLIESKHVAEAEAALQEALRINPDNGRFAMLLARLMVDRGDVAGALALLRPRSATESDNAEYHAFVAALQQRLGQHRPAIEQFQAALRITPGAAIWWAGLAMSYEATDQPKDALDAYKRAKSAGNLRPDLATFVDSKLRQLQ